MVSLPACFPIGHRVHAQGHGPSSGSDAQHPYGRPAFFSNLAGITQGSGKFFSGFAETTQGGGSQSGRFGISSYGRGMVTSRTSFIHAIGHHADAGTVFALALGLLAQSHGSLSSGFRIASHKRCILLISMALFANSNGIGSFGFPMGSRTDGNGIPSDGPGSAPDGPGSAPDGQSPFSLCVGIVAQGRHYCNSCCGYHLPASH